MKVAIIPARGGSKRILHKNIKLFCGEPIIAYSIQAALNSGCFDKVIVTTDDPEIAAVARDFGAETPFVRPAELSDDYTGTAAVITHALNWLINSGQKPEYACTLYATAPFVQPSALKNALHKLQNSPDHSYCFAVTEFSYPIQRAIKVTEEGGIAMFQPECFNSRSQDLETAYHDAGQFYWGKTDALLNELRMFSEVAIPYVLPKYLVQDIDTLDDWIRAEAMYKVLDGCYE